MTDSGRLHEREDRDVFRLAPRMDDAVLRTIAERLEFRGTDEGYERVSQAYFQRIPLSSATRILCVGCGTGIEVRALRQMAGAQVSIVGVDHSPTLVETAQRLTAEEGLGDSVTYQVGDAHRLAFTDGAFDIVTMHTLLSHVDDPLQVLREGRRVTRPGGTVAVFDGDYASLTFAHPDHALALSVEENLRLVMVANPRVMRDLPLLLREAALEVAEADGALYADIGIGGFWANAAESYSAVLARSGLLEPGVVEEWRAFQAQASKDHTFFAASAYYTYLAHRPG